MKKNVLVSFLVVAFLVVMSVSLLMVTMERVDNFSDNVNLAGLMQPTTFLVEGTYDEDGNPVNCTNILGELTRLKSLIMVVNSELEVLEEKFSKNNYNTGYFSCSSLLISIDSKKDLLNELFISFTNLTEELEICALNEYGETIMVEFEGDIAQGAEISPSEIVTSTNNYFDSWEQDVNQYANSQEYRDLVYERATEDPSDSWSPIRRWIWDALYSEPKKVTYRGDGPLDFKECNCMTIPERDAYGDNKCDCTCYWFEWTDQSGGVWVHKVPPKKCNGVSCEDPWC